MLPAWAGPTGGTVVSGQAIIQSLSQQTLITQSTAKAIINWNIFSIFKGQSVVFQQPSATSIVLNRVLGNQPSTILGTLSANGQVWLINPNGVLFGKSATINVAGLLATTADIANSSFLSGKYDFTAPSGNPSAGIVNLGTILTSGGATVLAAPTVDNEGTITAHLGTVALGAGKTFSVDFDGDNLLSFAVTSPAANAQVNNTGTLAADGGTVQITARAAGTIVDNVINTSGIVQANSVSIKNGTVILDGGTGGVSVTGTISTQGNSAGATGGTVKVLGNAIDLAATAIIDVSGRNGGGTVLVGGNFHGAGPELNANVVTIAQGATIEADATMNGNGGQVAVWSNESTTFDGAISARGGNGGYVETSSAGALTVAGTVDAGAPLGLPGNWLLDPDDLTVDAAAANSIDSALNDNTSVTLQNTATVASGTGTITSGGSGDITVMSGLTWNTPATQTLTAFRNIDVEATIDVAGAGQLALTVNNNIGGTSGNGALQFLSGGSVQFTGAEGAGQSLTINGASYALLYSMTEVQSVNNNLTGDYALAKPLDASLTTGWVPLGADNLGNVLNGGNGFAGMFNGLGNSISNLTVTSALPNVGLFAVNSGMINSLGLANVTVNSTGNDAAAGALAGTNNGAINNSWASGAVVGQSSDGGDAMLGGLVGFNSSTGVIAGGSFANVAVSDNANYGDDYLGGLVGHNEGMLFQTDATGAVTGTGAGVENGWGGLVGVLDSGTVSQSFATGNVTNNGDDEPNMGGLVGKQNGGSIVNSFATGAVVTNSANGGVFMGGLVGWQTGGSIATSFSVGLVQCPGQACSQGGMIGVGGGTVDSASFWDTQSSGQATSGGGAGLTTAQAESASFLQSIGWNFASVTNIQNGSSYPFLQWFGHPITPTEIVSGVAPDGATVDLLIDGVSSGQITAASNGVFDFSLPSGTSGVALAYLPSGSADAVSPLSGAGAAGLTLVASGAVTLQGQGGPVQVSMLNTAEGGASGTGLLYRVASNTVTLNPNISLTVTGGAGNVTVDNAIVASGTGLVTISGAGIALAANITSGLGFVLASPVTLNNSVTLTGGIGIAAFGGTVDTGTNNIVVVADQMSLASNQPWSGTGTRTLYPFTANSPITLAPNEGTTPAPFNLTAAELADLAGGAPAMVTIGSATAPASGALTTGDFTFDVPITLVGSSITIDPLTKNDGALTLPSSGAVTGSIALGTGTGTLTASAGSLDMTGTVNGASGAAAVPFIALVQPLGAGPFLFNGVNILSPNNTNTNTNTNGNAAATTIAQSNTTTNNTAPTSPPPFNVTNVVLPVDYADNQQSAAATPIDSGATLFETISPTAPTDLSVSASGSDATLVAYANPAPVTAAVNGSVPPPRVVRPLGPYVGETLAPTVPRGGVPGISFGYSLTGNSVLW